MSEIKAFFKSKEFERYATFPIASLGFMLSFFLALAALKTSDDNLVLKFLVRGMLCNIALWHFVKGLDKWIKEK